MAIEILMPALSPTMTEGMLATWLKKEGDLVESGDVIVEIETDKATMEVEATDSGTLGKILIAAGTEGVPVNQIIGLLLEEGEDIAGLEAAEPQNSLPVSAKAPAIPTASSTLPSPSDSHSDRIFASPLARRLAAGAGIDLSLIKGSGPRGRVVKRDIERAPPATNQVSAQATAVIAPVPVTEPAPIPTDQSFVEVPNSSMRKIIAKRLTQAKREVPHFYLTIDCRIDELLDMRRDFNEREGTDYKLSVNDFIIRAVALALRKVPQANASWTEESIRLFNEVDVSIAVSTPGGLITPIVRKADTKGLRVISNEIKELAARAREGKLAPEEYQGGGFTISNLGMFGVKEFSAIINPPQSCILAIGAGEQRPVVVNGGLTVATVMSCTMSVDHRAVDGAIGAEFLSVFKKYIEDPLSMLL